MVIFHAIKASWLRRMQFAVFAGLASVLILAVGSKSLRAEWFALKKSQVPAESKELPPNDGFDKAIRNILKEANRHEKKGELDQAIILAERAGKIVEDSSSLVKISPDISPKTISEYVKDLRLQKQKVELSLKRSKSSTPTTTSIASSPLTRESTANNKQNRAARAKSAAVTEPVSSRVRRRESSETALDWSTGGRSSPSQPESRRDDTATVSVSKASREISNSEPDDFRSPSDRPVESITTNKARRQGKPASSIDEPPFEPFAENEPRLTNSAEVGRSIPQPDVISKDAVQSEAINQKPESEDLTLISSSSDDSVRLASLSDSQPVKLRFRYRAGEKDIKPLPTESIESTGDLRTFETESKDTTSSIKTGETSREREQQPLKNRPEEEFPVIQVRDLRPAADISSPLAAGETQSTSTTSTDDLPETVEEHQFVQTKTLSPFRIRRTLKLRNTYSVLPLLTPTVARATREPVVGRTSFVLWRPAKEASHVETSDIIAENNIKTDASTIEIRRMQSDNDKSVIDHGSTGIRHGSARNSEIQTAAEVITESFEASTNTQSDDSSKTAHRQIRGSLWDNAAVPTSDATWRSAKPQLENLRKAPLPPKTNDIEQTAFTQTHQTVKKDLRSELNRSSIENEEQATDSSVESTSETFDFEETTAEETPVEATTWFDDVDSTDAVVANDSIQQPAGQTGLPESTVSTMLGAFGVSLLIAGIWMVRATAGIKHD